MFLTKKQFNTSVPEYFQLLFCSNIVKQRNPSTLNAFSMKARVYNKQRASEFFHAFFICFTVLYIPLTSFLFNLLSSQHEFIHLCHFEFSKSLVSHYCKYLLHVSLCKLIVSQGNKLFDSKLCLPCSNQTQHYRFFLNIHIPLKYENNNKS